MPFAVCSPAYAETSAEQVTLPNAQIQVNGTDESVSGNRGPWTDISTMLVENFAPRESLYALGGVADEFSQVDSHYTFGGYAPLGGRAMLNLQGSFSPTHHVLPETDLLGSIEYRMAGGWGAAGGYEHRTYTAVGATIYSLALDRYIGNYHFSYRATAADLADVRGIAITHDLRATRYYGRRGDDSIGLDLNAGRDVENIGNGVLVSGVRGASVSGVNWVDRDWAFNWSYETLVLNKLYSRSGPSLGLRFRL